jgi:hypothetical protein
VGGDDSDADDEEDTEFGSEEPSDGDEDMSDMEDLATVVAGSQEATSTVLERVRPCAAATMQSS